MKKTLIIHTPQLTPQSVGRSKETHESVAPQLGVRLPAVRGEISRDTPSVGMSQETPQFLVRPQEKPKSVGDFPVHVQSFFATVTYVKDIFFSWFKEVLI